MKKVLLTLFGIVAVASIATAQEQKTTWGVRAGLNVANMTVKSGNVKVSYDARASFNVGASLQQSIAPRLPFFLETGLYLSGNGSKYTAGGETIKITPMYLKLPVAVSYHFNVKNVVNIQPYVGFYYGLGLGGKLKYESGAVSEEFNLFRKTTLEFGNESYEMSKQMKRSDFGMRFGVGVAFRTHYYLTLGYDLGLVNTAYKSTDSEFDYGTLKNKAFFISLGYNF